MWWEVMVGGGLSGHFSPAVKSQSERETRTVDWQLKITGDQDQEDALPLLADVPGCLFAHSLSSLPHRRRAHLLLFSPTLSNVNSHTEASWTPREYRVPIPVFKIKYFTGFKAACGIKSVRVVFC